MASTNQAGVKTSPWSATRCFDLTRLRSNAVGVHIESEEDEDEVLVFGRVPIGVQFVSGEPELGFKADVGGEILDDEELLDFDRAIGEKLTEEEGSEKEEFSKKVRIKKEELGRAMEGPKGKKV